MNKGAKIRPFKIFMPLFLLWHQVAKVGIILDTLYFFLEPQF